MDFFLWHSFGSRSITLSSSSPPLLFAASVQLTTPLSTSSSRPVQAAHCKRGVRQQLDWCPPGFGHPPPPLRGGRTRTSTKRFFKNSSLAKRNPNALLARFLASLCKLLATHTDTRHPLAPPSRSSGSTDASTEWRVVATAASADAPKKRHRDLLQLSQQPAYELLLPPQLEESLTRLPLELATPRSEFVPLLPPSHQWSLLVEPLQSILVSPLSFPKEEEEGPVAPRVTTTHFPAMVVNHSDEWLVSDRWRKQVPVLDFGTSGDKMTAKPILLAASQIAAQRSMDYSKDAVCLRRSVHGANRAHPRVPTGTADMRRTVSYGGMPATVATGAAIPKDTGSAGMSPAGLLSPASDAESRSDTPIQTPHSVDVLGAADNRVALSKAWNTAVARTQPVADDEEVILVPSARRQTGTKNEARATVCPLPSPKATPGPISQANSHATVLLFNPASANVDPELVSELGSPFSMLSTPSTAIPSPYNKFLRPSINVRTDVGHTAVAPTAYLKNDERDGMPMTDTASRWSRAPSELPQNWMGTGRAVMRKSPPLEVDAIASAVEMNVDESYPAWMPDFDTAYPMATDEPVLAPSPLAYAPLPYATSDTRHPNHRTAMLDEDTATAFAYWFAGRIVHRLAYPTPAVGTRAHRQASRHRPQRHFDPYHVVPGHTYANGQIQVSYDLAFNMYQILESIQNVETLMAAVYFLERLPLHDVDGQHGMEFRTHFVPRRAGDVPFALERRVAAITIMLAQNTLEDRDFHLPNNMMWQIGGLEKTRFNRLKLLALQDLEWDVDIKAEAWNEHIASMGNQLYVSDYLSYGPPPYLDPQHSGILANAFNFMCGAAAHSNLYETPPSANWDHVQSPYYSSPMAERAPHVSQLPSPVDIPSPVTTKSTDDYPISETRNPTPPPPARIYAQQTLSVPKAAERTQNRKVAIGARSRRARAAYMQRASAYLHRPGRVGIAISAV